MNSFKRAVYKIGLPEEMKQISCNDSLAVDGKEGIYEVEITIGTGIGESGLDYDAINIPDRFQLFFDGDLVADSKFVGGSLESRKSDLLTVNKLLPIFEFDGENFIDTGRTETINISSSDIANGTPTEPTSGKGQLKFEKNKAEVTTMKLRVTGVLGGTLWNATPICPNQSETTSSGGSTSPKASKYSLITFRYIPNMSCEDFDQGTIRDYYSNTGLEIGSKLYLDSQLTNLAPSGHAYLGRTIYDLNNGIITDIYPCHKGLGI